MAYVELRFFGILARRFTIVYLDFGYKRFGWGIGV